MLINNEIKRFLERCGDASITSETVTISSNDMAFLCVLINRLEAENERLKNKLDVVKQKVIETIPLVEDDIKTIKAEAYKEYAERLCEDRVSNDPVVIAAKCLLKELVGEDNGESSEKE